MSGTEVDIIRNAWTYFTRRHADGGVHGLDVVGHSAVVQRGVVAQKLVQELITGHRLQNKGKKCFITSHLLYL